MYDRDTRCNDYSMSTVGIGASASEVKPEVKQLNAPAKSGPLRKEMCENRLVRAFAGFPKLSGLNAWSHPDGYPFQNDRTKFQSFSRCRVRCAPREGAALCPQCESGVIRDACPRASRAVATSEGVRPYADGTGARSPSGLGQRVRLKCKNKFLVWSPLEITSTQVWARREHLSSPVSLDVEVGYYGVYGAK
ncbi:hypothetical protein GOBAR_AA15180 [Gossypium barbadense]|uniref:Uncharacterized protein n=1 Tax=Gossypium barbadense TaxID=3634 RepID=A0A2P5XQ57_GOSBA|nr:hypothetical protein GOBAR_AA15180 [Gossypium barbadense]